MELLKPYQRERLKHVCNNINIVCNNSNILKNLNKFYNYVIDEKNYVKTTSRDILIILNKFLINMNQEKTAKIVYEKAVQYNKDYLKCELEQGLSEREKQNYVKYDDLFNKVQTLIDVYNSNKTKKNIINLLILSLYVLQPPLRNNYNDIKLIYTDNQETDSKQNYLLITDNLMYVIINNDKVTNSHGRGEIPIPNKTLDYILRLYINSYAFNNTYLFENNNGTPFTKRQIQYIINNYFKNVNKILNIHCLRSAYITNFYKHNHSLISKNDLADKMRHTQRTSELIYCKMI